MLNHVDIPRLDALNKHWSTHPPVQWMIAAYFGIGKKSTSQNLEEALEYVPVETMKTPEFDSLLTQLGIPENR